LRDDGQTVVDALTDEHPLGPVVDGCDNDLSPVALALVADARERDLATVGRPRHVEDAVGWGCDGTIVDPVGDVDARLGRLPPLGCAHEDEPRAVR
jgi:hypothetical protein